MTERPLGDVAAASLLEAEPEAVWARVTTPEGINAELRPLMRMTVPDGLSPMDPRLDRAREADRAQLGPALRVPPDRLRRDQAGRALTAARVRRAGEPLAAYWRHEPTIEPLEDGRCVLTDRIAWRPRLPVPPGTLAPVFRAIFRHRHRRLRDHFGGRPAAPATD